MRTRALALVVALVGLLGAGLPAKAIVGGSATPNGALPFMAVVEKDGSFICGGTVIAPQWVLTAAHCIEAGAYTVLIGTNNRNSGGQRFNATATVDPNYDSGAITNDAALLHLSGSTSAPRIALSGAGDDGLEADGAAVTVAGWGDITPITGGLLAPAGLRQVNLNVVSDQKCFNTTSSVEATSEVCASALLKDSCQGDSGGPLFASTSSGPKQIGIVSHGFLCAIPLFPGSYSEVNSAGIRGWIAATAGV
jgi:secreted trypsin-like serine protease